MNLLRGSSDRARTLRLGLALMGAALAWRAVRYGLVFPMWGDEAMLAVNFHSRGFVELLQPLDYGQVAPPGFLWAQLAVRRALGFTEASLRLIPFVAGLATVPLFWLLARKLLDRRAALLALAVFAASFYPTRYAAEVKPYSVDLLMALCVLLVTLAVRSRPTAGRWAALGALGAVASWLSYPSIFVSGGALVWLLLVEGRVSRRREVRHILPAVAAVLAIVTAFVASVALAGAQQRVGAPSGYWAAGFPPITRPWLLPVWALDVHSGMMLAYPNGGHSGGSAVSLLLAIVGGAALWRARRPELLLLLSPLPFMFLAAALRLYPYGASARVAQHVAPAACLLIGAGILAALLRLLGTRRTIRVLPLVVLPFLLVAVAGIGRDLVRPYYSPADARVRRIVRELAAEAVPGEKWVVYASWSDTGSAPHFSRLVGMGGRIQFQLLSLSPDSVLWAPAARDLASHPTPLTLIAYGNRVFEPEPVRWRSYVSAAAAATGRTAESERHELPDREWIEVVRLR